MIYIIEPEEQKKINGGAPCNRIGPPTCEQEVCHRFGIWDCEPYRFACVFM